VDWRADWRTTGRRQGAYCVICGAGPFTFVAQHSRQVHGIRRGEYKRRFPGALLTDPSFVHAFRLEAREKGYGNPKGKRGKRFRYCRRGHPMMGTNVHIRPNGDRQCRRCQALGAARATRTEAS
jgi:hypothetical protein